MAIQYNNQILVPWKQPSTPWNEICAGVVERFGLPGDRWTYHPTETKMKFLFRTEEDALLCKIFLSEYL